jgi:hypothetical protein
VRANDSVDPKFLEFFCFVGIPNEDSELEHAGVWMGQEACED